MKKTRRKKGSIFSKLLIVGIVLLLGNRACSPPGINEEDILRTIDVQEIFDDVRDLTNKPVRVMGEVVSSFFIAELGGFYFLQSPNSTETILGLTKGMPPEEGAMVNVVCVVKPAVCKGEVNILYLKTEKVKTLLTSGS